uniref:ATP-binding protein n=1 Tax=Flavobacterium sp. TaxID=239 RepID=UPI0025DD7F1E
MSHLKKTGFLIICSIFFFSCNKGKDVAFLDKGESLDTLLNKVGNINFDKKIRLQYADMILEKIKFQENDSITRNNYYQLADLYYNLQENQKSNMLYRTLSLKSKKANDISGIAKSNYCIAYNYYYGFNYDSAFYYFSNAEKAYKELKNSTYLGSIISSKSNILSFKKDFSGSEVLAIKALKIGQKNKDYLLIYNCYITLGNALVGLNNEDKAVEYYRKAFQITDNLKSNSEYLSLKAQAYNYIGLVHQKNGANNKSISYFEQGLKFGDFRRIDPTIYVYLMGNLAYSRFKTGDKKSLFLFNNVLKISDSLNNIPAQVSCKINLSEYYLAQKDTSKALININDARQKAHDSKIFEDELKCLALLVKIDPKKNFFYNSSYIKLSDSLQNNERATRDKYARIEFETDEILNQKNNIEVEKDSISLQRWLILGLSLFALLIILLWFMNKTQKSKNKELQFIQQQQRSNEEIYQLMLDQQQKVEQGKQAEKKRISQELHDGVMGRLTSIRLNLFVLSRKTDPETINKCLQHIKEIQNVEKEIRIIAHDLNKNFFSDQVNFIAIVKNLFTAIEHHS